MNHQVLRRDLEGDGHALDHEMAEDEAWTAWWNQWPIGRWLAKQKGKTWFVQEGDHFRLAFDVPEQLKPAFESMTEEIVEWRLAAYAKSRRLVATEPSEVAFTAKVSHANGRPILFLPEKAKEPNRPVGVTRVQLPDGAVWEFKFVKVACNVAKPSGETKNQLGTLLQDWFGPNAGLPGTNFTVVFENRGEGWQAKPEGVPEVHPAERLELPEDVSTIEILDDIPVEEQFTTHAPVYDLFVAAGGWGDVGSPDAIGWVPVPNQRLKEGMFAAQVTGHSMEPTIPSGSWCLFRPCPQGSREGRLLLVQVPTICGHGEARCHSPDVGTGCQKVCRESNLSRQSNHG